MRANPFLFLAAAGFVLAAFSGCLSQPSSGLSASEAPLGPRSLRVGSYHIGDYYRTAYNVTGYTIDGDFVDGEVEWTVEPFEDHNYVEQRIAGNITARDAFGRSVDVIREDMRYTDVDPGEYEVPIREESLVWEPAGKSLVYLDSQQTWTSCINGACQQDVRNLRMYPRAVLRNETHWASLEGQVFTLGKTVSFNQTISYRNDDEETKLRFYVNFTARRETTVDGVRAFQLEPTSAIERLTPMRERVDDEEEPDPDSPFSKKPVTPRPKSTHYLWVTSKSPIPVKEEAHQAFAFDGQWYWQNYTRILETHEGGTVPVHWGQGTPPPKVDLRPGVTTVPGSEFVAKAQARATHDLPEAWAALRADATQPRFQEYMAAHPEALPFLGTYFADGAHNAYTWNLFIDDGTDTIQAAESRFQGVGPTSVGIVQNRIPNARFGGEFLAPNASEWKAMKLVTFADLEKDYRESWKGPGEPSAQFYVRTGGWNYFGPSTAQSSVYAGLSFFPTTVTSLGGPNPLGTSTRWRAVNSVSYDLVDGGLLGLNLTFTSGFSDWPWLPLGPVLASDLASVGIDVAPTRGAAMDMAALPWWGDGFLPRPPHERLQNG